MLGTVSPPSCDQLPEVIVEPALRATGSSLADCQVDCQALGLVSFRSDIGGRVRAVYLQRWTVTDGAGRAGKSYQGECK
jgi:hypothetical protein